jgi:hypothetical protein
MNLVQYDKVEDVNKLFNISLFNDVFITIFNNSTEPNNLISDIDVHGNSDIYKSIKEKILNYCNTIDNADKHYYNIETICNKNDNILVMTGVRGNPGCDDFYTIVSDKIKPNDFNYLNKITIGILYKFNTENESINFLQYLKTKFARFCLSIYKRNVSIFRGELASVPYMPTYTRPWSDDECAKELGLTDEELKWMIDWIPDYYPEDEQKYKLVNKTWLPNNLKTKPLF